MKKLVVTLITLSLLLLPSLAYAHNFGPIPSTGCPANHTPNTSINSCIHNGANTGPNIGKIEVPANIPTAGADPSAFVAGIIRAFIQILIIAAFIIALIWTIFAGYSFIFAGGDPKNISSAWSRIYWGLLGLVIVVGAYAIIKLVETAFNVKIISDFKLPQRP